MGEGTRAAHRPDRASKFSAGEDGRKARRGAASREDNRLGPPSVRWDCPLVQKSDVFLILDRTRPTRTDLSQTRPNRSTPRSIAAEQAKERKGTSTFSFYIFAYNPITRMMRYPTVIMTTTATIDAGMPLLKKSAGSRYRFPTSSSWLIAWRFGNPLIGWWEGRKGQRAVGERRRGGRRTYESHSATAD